MRVHTTTRPIHWTLATKNVQCPECGATHSHACSYRAQGQLVVMPRNTVHVERVHAAGHATKFDELPIHRAKIPDGGLAELRKLK